MGWSIGVHEFSQYRAHCQQGFKVDPNGDGPCEWEGPVRDNEEAAERDVDGHREDHERGWAAYGLRMDFPAGARVRFTYGHGETVDGVVSSTNHVNVFVVFDGKTQSESCSPDMLTVL